MRIENIQLENIAKVKKTLDTGDKGVIKNTIDNIVCILTTDKNICNFYYYDEVKGMVVNTQTNRTWQDTDDSTLIWYLETYYELFDTKKYYAAFDNAMGIKRRNILKEILESEPWDGKPRIDKFLNKILKTDDDDYHREVSRMIFYGGINRLYHPGCKFDYMPILIGKQGNGKSTLVKWLSLDTRYFSEVNTIDGKDGVEAIHGQWICEMAELLAMVRTKEVEAMKSFITKQVDKYRPAYARRVVDRPRTSIIIGTTNTYEFLTDMTGNRRFLPVHMNLDLGELFLQEKFIKHYILECWREALQLMRENKTYLTIPMEYMDVTIEKQNEVCIDDPKESEIYNYLLNKEIGYKVSSKELFVECFHGISKNYNRTQASQISIIMSSFPNWVRSTDRIYFKDYGRQRYWTKIDLSKKDKL